MYTKMFLTCGPGGATIVAGGNNRVSELDHILTELQESYIQVINLYTSLQKQKRDYGCGRVCTMAEIHFIQLVGDHASSNCSELASHYGVNRGYASRLLKHLEKRGFIERYQRPGNRKEVLFSLTELGKRAYEGHRKYDRELIDLYPEYFSDFSRSDLETVLRFLQRQVEAGKELFRLS